MVATLQRLVESARFQRFIIAVIVINAITLGLETSPSVMAEAAAFCWRSIGRRCSSSSWRSP
ncbi:hypothetical protein [Thauera humireducens]|uniref:hypothetical protein n=1 Tax=Thauera humireducens TaxID=1134435 RepID=UPI00311F17C3